MRRFFRAVRQLKWVYLAVCAAFVAGAVIYVCRSLPQVPVSAQMLIGEEGLETSTGSQLAGKGSGGMAQMLKTFSVGGFSAAAVDNEVLVIGSHEVLKNTVKALNLNRSYIGKSQSGKRKMLFRNSPVSVEAPAEYFDTLSISYKVRIKILDDGKADVKITKGFFGRTVADVEGVALPAMIKSPLGNFQILRTELFDSSPYRDITVNVAGNDLVATTLYSQVTIDVATKLSDVIQIDLDYPDAELGKAIVNGIMAEYNAKRLDRIHETAVNTIKYYDERIAETLRQLEQAERKVADYRQSRSLAAPEAEAGGLMALSQQQKLQALNARNELDYYNSVVSTLRSNLDGNTLIPQIESLGDTNIVAYNRLITQRKNLERSATPEHPKMILINERLATSFDIYGKGGEEKSLKELIERLGCGAYIHLKGQQNLEEVYKNYEAYVSASTSEGFGLTLMEAVGSGLPIIGFNVRYGNPTFIDNARNGYLIQVDDMTEKKERIRKLTDRIIKLFTKADLEKFHQHSYKKAENYLTAEVEKKWNLLLH